MPLISSQHFPVWVASWMSVWVRPCDFTLSRCVWLSLRMSAAVSISMNQSSNFEESCPSNVGISLEHGCGEIGFLPCCTLGVHVSLHGLVHWFPTGLGASWSTMVRCCSLSVSCGVPLWMWIGEHFILNLQIGS